MWLTVFLALIATAVVGTAAYGAWIRYRPDPRDRELRALIRAEGRTAR